MALNQLHFFFVFEISEFINAEIVIADFTGLVYKF